MLFKYCTEGTYLFVKWRNIIYCKVSDVFKIDICIRMNQTVSHTGHFSPGDFRILRAELFRDMFCCFTNNFNETDDTAAVERIS